jgi:BirA family biotin operon repressor/biotin-[acetyl-CoA-carboxylase] ligase
MDLDRVRRLLTTARIGRPITYLPATTSTMDVARERAAADAPEGLVVVADEQTAGRGRFGRAWVAPPGVNLLLSILLRPSAERMKRLGIVAPLAVAEAVRTVSGLVVRFKWPNDVLLGGRKLCGILVEGGFAGTAPVHAVVGIGLNVNLDPSTQPAIAATATSIAAALGRAVSREETLAALLNAFELLYDESDGERLRRDWKARLDTLGQEVEVTFAGRVERGVAEDVDAEGALVLRRPDGTRTALAAGEVTLRRGAPGPDPPAPGTAPPPPPAR